MMMGFGLVAILVLLLIFGVIIAFIAGIVRFFPQGRGGEMMSSRSEGAGARDILDQRYASGEINREEYEAMKNDLTTA